MPAVTKAMTGVVEKLVGRLKAIPEGQIAQVARAAGIQPRHLRKLRQGKSPDVRISTLEALARGLSIPMAELLGETKWQPPPQKEAVSPERLRAVERLLREAAKLGDAARELAELVQGR